MIWNLTGYCYFSILNFIHISTKIENISKIKREEILIPMVDLTFAINVIKMCKSKEKLATNNQKKLLNITYLTNARLMNFPFKVFRRKTLSIYFKWNQKKKIYPSAACKKYHLYFDARKIFLGKRLKQYTHSKMRLNWLNQKPWMNTYSLDSAGLKIFVFISLKK